MCHDHVKAFKAYYGSVNEINENIKRLCHDCVKAFTGCSSNLNQCFFKAKNHFFGLVVGIQKTYKGKNILLWDRFAQ